MIKKINIINFRSISKLEVDCGKMTIFVGNNDAGKSNILRALNLFFNGKTEHGVDFVFQRDFNLFAEKKTRKAPEIVIELTITLPPGYRKEKEHSNDIVWRKVWRKGGLHSDGSFRNFVGGQAFPGYSKIPAWLDRICFDYVPAIKDKHFFSDLQGKIYDVLSDVSETTLKSSAEEFESKIKGQVHELLSKVTATFSSESALALPQNLRQIFENLEFKRDGIPLSQRGDGIKIRHIPAIIAYIAEKKNSLKGVGSVKYTQIWGIEEPENNVELSSCYDMAKELSKITAGGRQMFLTTHSPVYYQMGIKHRNDAKVCWVYHNGMSSELEILDKSTIDERIGLMPLIAPYIEETKCMLDEAKRHIKNLEKCHVFVEGDTDAKVLRLAIDIYYESNFPDLTIETNGNARYGGAEALKNRALAWHLVQKNSKLPKKAVAIFDYDEAGRKAYKELKDKLKNENTHYVKAMYYKEPKNVIEMRTQGYEIPITLEVLFPESLWHYAKKRNWIESISLAKRLAGSKIDELINTTQRDDNFMNIIVRNNFKNDGKVAIVRHLAKMKTDELSKVLTNFRPTLEKIASYLS